jgi:gliding motility-associated-like protein
LPIALIRFLVHIAQEGNKFNYLFVVIFMFKMAVFNAQIDVFTQSDIACLDDEEFAVVEVPILKNDNFVKYQFSVDLDNTRLPKYGMAEIKRINASFQPTFYQKTYYDTILVKYKYFQSEHKSDTLYYTVTKDNAKSSSFVVFDIGCVSNAEPQKIHCQPDIYTTVDSSTCTYAFTSQLPTLVETNLGAIQNFSVDMNNPTSSLKIGVYDRIDIFGALFNNSIVDACETYVEVVDLIEPSILNCPENIVSCNSVVNYNAPTAIDICSNLSVSVIQTEGIRSGYEFPVGITKNVFEATDGAGNLAICSFDVEIVSPPPVTWLTNLNFDTICTSDAMIDFNDSISMPINENAVWVNTDYGVLNPSQIQAGTNVTVKLILSERGCEKEIERYVYVQEAPKLDFVSLPDDICIHAEPLDMDSYNQNNIVGDWYIDNILLQNDKTSTGLTVGDYVFSFKTRMISCPSEYRKTINVNEGLQKEDLTLSFCGKEGAIYYTSEIDSILEKSERLIYAINGDSLLFTADDFIKDTLKIIDFDGSSCRMVSTIQVSFDQEPSQADAGEDIDLEYNESVFQTNATETTIGTVLWIYDANNIELENSAATLTNGFFRNGSQNELILSVSNGICPTNFDTLLVSKEFLTVPTAFSPDGNGLNDFFVLHGMENTKVGIEIFNRWGQKVFEDTDYQNDWSGIDIKNNPLPDDVYFLKIKIENAEDINGKITIKR